MASLMMGKRMIKEETHEGGNIGALYLKIISLGIMNSLYDPSAVGETYEAVGPESVTMVRRVR